MITKRYKKARRFLKSCYSCGAKVKEAIMEKEGIKLCGMKCPKCGEEYFTSSELIKYDVLRGKRSLVRKFGVLGDSHIIRIPEKIVEELRIKAGDFGYFEKRAEGILIRPVSAKELNKI